MTYQLQIATILGGFEDIEKMKEWGSRMKISGAHLQILTPVSNPKIKKLSGRFQ